MDADCSGGLWGVAHRKMRCTVHCPSWGWVESGPKGIRMELRAWFH